MGYLKNIFSKGMYVAALICTDALNNVYGSKTHDILYESYVEPIVLKYPMPASAFGFASCSHPYENVFDEKPFDDDHVIGYINGSVYDVKVTGQPRKYDVFVQIHNKVFQSKRFRPLNYNPLTLTSRDGSQIRLMLGSDVSAINTAAKFEDALSELLGLRFRRAPATFMSASNPLNTFNNGLCEVKALGYCHTAGTYYLWSVANSNEIVLSYYQFFWKAYINRDGRQTVLFDNNICIDLDESYTRRKDIKNISFQISGITIRHIPTNFKFTLYPNFLN